MVSGRWFLSIRTKIVILLITFITVPFIVSGMFTYQKYTKDSEQASSAYANQIVTQMSLNLDRYIKEMERITLAPLYDPSLMSILELHSNSARKVDFIQSDEQLKMNLFISSLQFDHNEIRGIMVFTNDGQIFSNSDKTTKTLWLEEQNEWVQMVAAEDGGLTILPPHEVYYYADGKQTVVSIARKIREPFTHRNFGIIKVDLNAIGLERILTPVNLGVNSKIFVTNKLDQMLYPFTISNKMDYTDVRYLTTSIRSDYSNLVVTGQVPLNELRQKAADLTKFMLLISLISLLVAYVLAIWASNRLISPLLHLKRKMKQVQKGILSVRADIMTHDEIGQVTESFNNMISEIERLVKEVYEVKLRERETELSVLQSQMNPHFLYNTLESISMLAIQNDQMYLSSTVTNLGRLLRYTVNNRQSKVLLREEIRFSQAYLQIQVMRLGAKLKANISVDPVLEQALVPKLLIQCFIENAIEHGMGLESISIQVSAEILGEHLLIVIEDDGVGMDPATVQTVTARMTEDKDEQQTSNVFGEKRRGYALRNIHQRIHLLYGDSYGISIDHLRQKGVRFIIHLPLEWGA